jgi:putative PIN family toxin of toxin-antitoxin system
MTRKTPEIFLDTSVIIAAVMSPTGGARLLFHLAHADTINLVVGSGVLDEVEEVMQRKAPELLGLLAQLLDEAGVEISKSPTSVQQKNARSLLSYLPDANVLAEAISANPDWLVSHDKEHFVGNPALDDLPFKIGTPGDVIAWIREYLSI